MGDWGYDEGQGSEKGPRKGKGETLDKAHVPSLSQEENYDCCYDEGQGMEEGKGKGGSTFDKDVSFDSCIMVLQ